MYAHIDGIVAEKDAKTLVIDCGGVGYLMQVSAGTLAAVPGVGNRMKCYTVLSVREDAMELYGFATREERTMFDRLKGVSGIGPKTALAILSAISVRDLSIALVTGDAATLARAPGIGKKTAQRMILELRDKVNDEELTGISAQAAINVDSGPKAEAIEALMALGYAASEAADAVGRVQADANTSNEIVRLALRGMAK
ncbi:MAG: Holliday junction branch migration protein RuvA [Clostridia bacterium]|nr:Holliday junction branch migration protein RuvA [Clostridia bacterium]